MITDKLDTFVFHLIEILAFERFFAQFLQFFVSVLLLHEKYFLYNMVETLETSLRLLEVLSKRKQLNYFHDD